MNGRVILEETRKLEVCVYMSACTRVVRASPRGKKGGGVVSVYVCV